MEDSKGGGGQKIFQNILHKIDGHPKNYCFINGKSRAHMTTISRHPSELHTTKNGWKSLIVVALVYLDLHNIQRLKTGQNVYVSQPAPFLDSSMYTNAHYAQRPGNQPNQVKYRRHGPDDADYSARRKSCYYYYYHLEYFRDIKLLGRMGFIVHWVPDLIVIFCIAMPSNAMY